jgi:dTDP-glucose pyrophosphorylase
MQVLIPAAGEGKRFSESGYTLAKPYLPIDDKKMLIASALSMNLDAKFIFILRQNPQIYDLLNDIQLNFKKANIEILNEVTEGAADTCLHATDYLDLDDELIIANCDQIMNWDSNRVLNELRQYNGGLVCIKSNDPKHSYVKLDTNNYATYIKEKECISEYALTGIHYWKEARDFVNSASMMIHSKIKSKNEYYISETYNLLIKQGKRIGISLIENSDIHFIGTPIDYETYNNASN